MKEFYHVSRGDLSDVKHFDLQYFSGFIEAETMFSAEEFIDFKKESYPGGISRHGERYLHLPFRSEGPNLAFARNELILETTFELVRQLKFSDRKSRFQVSFGCLTIEDAIRIKTETFQGIGEIYKVSCEKYFVADMNFVRQVGSIIGLQIIAEKYWNGESSPNPFYEVLMEHPVNILEKIQ